MSDDPKAPTTQRGHQAFERLHSLMLNAQKLELVLLP